ncbi:MAG TPA: tetratricopeptide repeat protein [Candidatus Aminicenantes bacterium]|nr:tetratricopeptide repeat protein [Candidatus Aminicenantes bacterium]
MKTKAFRSLSLAIAALFLAAGFAAAQAGRGTARLTGVVTDQSGAPLEGVKVNLAFSQSGAKHEAKTNKKGEWSFMGLGTGGWELTILKDGFEPFSQHVQVSQLNRNPKIETKLRKAASGGGIIQDEATFGLLEQGNRFFTDGRYDEAIIEYESFLEKNPLAYQVQLNIADAYRMKGDYAKAEEFYGKVLEKAAGDQAMGKQLTGKAQAGIGDIFLRQNKLAEAQEYFKKSIESAPDDEVLAYNVGEIYFSNQALDEAQRYFELASKIKPEWPAPYLKLGYVFLNKADNPAAIAVFEKFLALEPEGERAALVKNILAAIKK